jgi:hypothetical protein
LDDLLAMKGLGRVVMTLLGEGRAYTVLTYADGSFALKRDTLTLGIWEADKIDDCLEAFVRVSPKPSDADPLNVLLVKGMNKYEMDLPAETVRRASTN